MCHNELQWATMGHFFKFFGLVSLNGHFLIYGFDWSNGAAGVIGT